MIFKKQIRKAVAKLKSRRNTVMARRAKLLPYMDGRTFQVHNGKKYVPLAVVPLRLYFKFGEFAFTRKRTFHKKKKKIMGTLVNPIGWRANSLNY